MKNTILSAIFMAFVLVSCNQKAAETTTDDSNEMGNENAVMVDDSTMIDDKTKTMDHEKMYACSMHPEVKGKMHDKCPKCGMELTEPVPEQ